MKTRIFYFIVGIIAMYFSYICARNYHTCVSSLKLWYFMFSGVFGIGSTFPILFSFIGGEHLK